MREMHAPNYQQPMGPHTATQAAPARTSRENFTREELERELERFHASSFGWALTCCRWDHSEAEDVLQSAYVKAMENVAGYRGHSSPRSWFFAIVRNTAAERRRKRVVRGEALLRWFRREIHRGPDPSPEKLSGDEETRGRVRRALDRLSARQRDVLQLVFYQQLTIEQAAEVLGVPIGTARTHYQRGKGRLRTLIGEDGR